MFAILIGVFLFFGAFVWGVFILQKINSNRYQMLDENISRFTRFFGILLIVLTCIGIFEITRISLSNEKFTQENYSNESVYY